MKYKLQELIDIKRFQELQDSLNEIYTFPSSIIDNSGNILTATAWQDVCTQFHRKNKDAEQVCIQSDQYIQKHIHEANPGVTYRCPHGLVDNAIPIIVDGVHYGNFFTGQFFLEEPDLAFFSAQAKQYGFNEADYISAVKKVPIWTQAQLDRYLMFIKGLIDVIAESGLKRLKEIENRRRIEAEKRIHRSILQTAMDGFWMTDTEGHLLEVNAAYCKMSGYTENELLQMRILDLEAIENEKMIARHMERVAILGSERFETQHRRKDGSVFDLEISLQFRHEDGGRCVVFLRDISERKAAERERIKLTERLNLATKAANLGVWDWNIAENELIWDDGMYAIYGVEKNRFPNVYEAWLNSIHPDDRQKNDEISRQARRGEREYDTEFRIIKPDGAVRHIKALGQVIRDSDNNPTRMIGINYDITSEKEMEVHLQRTQKMEAIGHLASGIAHDFNNILFPIVGLSELLLEDLDPRCAEYENAQEILSAGKRGSELVKQILALSRQTDDKVEPVKIQDIVNEVFTLCRATIPKDIELYKEVQNDCSPVLANPTQLHQVMMNLVTNAFHAVEQGNGKISIELKEIVINTKDIESDFIKPGRYASLSLTDNGIGIPPEVMDKIFEPYFTTKKEGKGTGLGLATVHGIVKEHKGEIKVSSNPNMGTVVTVYLPLMRNADQNTTAAVQSVIDLGHEHILVIDDEAAIARLEMQILERFGYTVTMKTDSMEALNDFKTHPDVFDLVLTDMQMPHMSGMELARQLRLIKPDVPIVLCTGFSEKIDRKKSEDLGIKGFLMKPVVMSEMAQMVRSALDNVGS